MKEYISTVKLLSEVIDCRMLQLEVEFHQLRHQQLKELAEFCYAETKELMKDIFFCNWSFSGHKIKNCKNPKVIADATGYIDFFLEGYVYSDVVYNVKTYKQYWKNFDMTKMYDLRLYHTEKPMMGIDVPIDYPEFFHQVFDGVQTPDEYKKAMLQIFNEPGRKSKAFWRNSDVYVGFISTPYHNNPAMYYGDFTIRMNVECLGDYVELWAEKLRDFIYRISEREMKVCGRVAVSPIGSPSRCSGYLNYFADEFLGNTDYEELGYWDIEWLPFYYIYGVEWFNLISPIQRGHLPNILEDAKKYPDIAVQELTSGGLTVFSKKGILQTDIPELMSMKRLLYHALYPGKSEILMKYLWDPEDFGYKAKPRHQWELIPMFEEEIIVERDRIVFRHKTQKK